MIYLKFVRFFCCLCVVIILSGCQTPKITNLAYLRPDVEKNEKSFNGSVEIGCWQDEREEINDLKGLWLLVPLVPYGSFEFQHNECTVLENSHKSGFLKKAIIRLYSNKAINTTIDQPCICQELENDVLLSLARAIHSNRVFKRNALETESTFFIKPTLHKWNHKYWITTYLLGPYGAFLWGLGFPYGGEHYDVAFSLAFIHVPTNKILFKKKYDTKTRSNFIGLPMFFGWAFNYRNPNKSFEAQDLAPFFTKSLADFINNVQKCKDPGPVQKNSAVDKSQ